jgi:deoxyuridine 5'-triphosphate nucleotidohydrolase
VINERQVLRVGLVRSSPHATLPTQAHPGDDVGFDLCSDNIITLVAGKVTRVTTGLRQAFPPQAPFAMSFLTPYLKIEGRSGLASKGIWPVGGIIDPGYTGEIQVALFNSTAADYQVNVGDKIAQLVCYYVAASANDAEVSIYETNVVGKTSRNDGGFGSSGK